MFIIIFSGHQTQISHAVNKLQFKITFGVENESIANYIMFHIKSVVFRSCFKISQNFAAGKSQLIKKCKSNIKQDLKSKFNIAKSKNKIDELFNIFSPSQVEGENIHFYFWKINEEHNLEFF